MEEPWDHKKIPTAIAGNRDFQGLESAELLLAAIALQKIHWVNGNCVTADVVIVIHVEPPSV